MGILGISASTLRCDGLGEASPCLLDALRDPTAVIRRLRPCHAAGEGAWDVPRVRSNKGQGCAACVRLWQGEVCGVSGLTPGGGWLCMGFLCGHGPEN